MPPTAFDYKAMTAFLKKLEIGDSFICTPTEKSRIGTCAYQAGVKVATQTERRESDGGKTGNYRVWRVS